MDRKQAKKLYKKFLDNNCTPEELKLLNRFLDSYQKEDTNWPESEYGSEEELTEKMLQAIKTKIGSSQKAKRKSSQSYLKYVAIFVVLTGIVIYFQSNKETPVLDITDESVVLKLGNNEIKKIDSKSQQSIADKNGEVIGTQSGAQLTYLYKDNIRELVYNEIMVPKGKKFELVLSDGTFVHLNAETTLKYPVNFIAGKKRQVYLNGEAYFEVKRDEEDPFLVYAENMEIKVLGTHFSINTYNGLEPFAVLIEGSVSVSQTESDNVSNIPEIINPGQKAAIIENNIQIKNVNVNNYIDWRNGNLTFIDLPFSEIIQKIERKYNVKILNDYGELNDIKFNGRFEDETILDLLDVFKESAEFEYQIKDNQIMIIKP